MTNSQSSLVLLVIGILIYGNQSNGFELLDGEFLLNENIWEAFTVDWMPLKRILRVREARVNCKSQS